MRRALAAAGAAGLIAAGAYGAGRIAGTDESAPPPVAPAVATTGRTADDVLLDAIDNRFAARSPRTPAGAARREYRDWIAERFGPGRAAAPGR